MQNTLVAKQSALREAAILASRNGCGDDIEGRNAMVRVRRTATGLVHDVRNHALYMPREAHFLLRPWLHVEFRWASKPIRCIARLSVVLYESPSKPRGYLGQYDH